MENLNWFLQLLKRKDIDTYYHSQRVAYYSYLIGQQLHFTQKQLSILVISSLLHDIGKLQIPNCILKKTTSLTKEEYELMKLHTLYAKDILGNINSTLLDTILTHHERMDGSGYPYHLKGYNIPLYAQILAISDSFDAMTSHRNYNQIKSYSDAIQELLDCSTQN